jgi:hypothetical protein
MIEENIFHSAKEEKSLFSFQIGLKPHNIEKDNQEKNTLKGSKNCNSALSRQPKHLKIFTKVIWYCEKLDKTRTR